MNLQNNENNQIFHAGTYEKDSKIFSKGGRVLNITSFSENLLEARNNVLDNIKKINWKDGFFRNENNRRSI